MNLPGLLVEYLINGCIALLWVICLFPQYIIDNLYDSEKLLLIPVAYVIGMFIDYIAWLLTRPLKKLIRNSALNSLKKAFKESNSSIDINQYAYFWEEKVEIEKNYPDLNKEIRSRSSRDRIARGTIINLIALSICYWHLLSWIWIIFIGISFMMWIRFEHYNRCFEIRAAISIRTNKNHTD